MASQPGVVEGNTSLRSTRISQGFTIVELVTAIVVLSVLSVVSIPVFLEFRDEARRAAEAGVVGSVREGIRASGINAVLNGGTEYPPSLDGAAADSSASASNPFFSAILTTPMTEGWMKGESSNHYVSPLDNIFVYVPSTGDFLSETEFTALAAASSSGGTSVPVTAPRRVTSMLSDEAVAGMSPVELASLSDDEIRTLTAVQIAAMSHEQFAAIVHRLSTDQVPWALPEQVAMLSAEAYANLTSSQIAALTDSQRAERAISDNVRSLNRAQFRTVDPSHIKYLTVAQAATIDRGYLAQLSVDQRSALTPEHVQAIQLGSYNALAYLNEAQRQQITQTQIESLHRDSFAYLSAEQIPGLTVTQIATLTRDNIRQMSGDQRAAISRPQVEAISSDAWSESFSYFTDEQQSWRP